MTTAEMICLIADGIRAGTIRMDRGTAMIRDVGRQGIAYTPLDEPWAPSKIPLEFTFECTADFSQAEKREPR